MNFAENREWPASRRQRGRPTDGVGRSVRGAAKRRPRRPERTAHRATAAQPDRQRPANLTVPYPLDTREVAL